MYTGLPRTSPGPRRTPNPCASRTDFLNPRALNPKYRFIALFGRVQRAGIREGFLIESIFESVDLVPMSQVECFEEFDPCAAESS